MSALQSPSARQRGAVTLFLSLLMLLLITVLVTTAFTMSTTGLRSVGNMQARNEAIAAAQLVIETELGGPFYTTPAALSGQTRLGSTASISEVSAAPAWVPICASLRPLSRSLAM